MLRKKRKGMYISLDPTLKRILEHFPKLPEPLTLELILKIREARIQAVLAENKQPSVHAVEDRLISGPNGEIPIRIYTPNHRDEHLPAVVFFHGGGWTFGHIETHDIPCRQLANASGCKVISVDYRLAPEHRFPRGLEDCYAATEWVFNYAEELEVDANRIAVGGDSAGGNLAAAVALWAKDRRGPQIWRQILIYPAVDALQSIENSPYKSIRENAQAPILTSSLTKSFWDFYLETEADVDHHYASPIKAKNVSGLPQAFVITAEYDPIRDEGEAYASRLQDSGVAVQMTRYNGLCHGFLTLPLPINKQVMQSIGEWLKG
jgi:acetyl esterase